MSRTHDLGIVDGLVYLEGTFLEANIYISKGKIVDITTNYYAAKEEYTAREKWVLPGFIDPHVHFSLNLGKYTSVDDFKTGSISALFGGVTTFIDFLDPITTVSEFEKAFSKRLKEAQSSYADYSFHLTLANTKESAENFIKKAIESGLPSIKVFTAYSSSNRKTFDGYLYSLMEAASKYNLTILIHAENEEMIIENVPVYEHSKARPEMSEITQIIKIAEMVKHTGAKVYIVHTTCGTIIEELSLRFKDILNEKLFIESCPHYFYFNSEAYLKENGYLYTMTPPLRSKNEQKKLIKNISGIFSIGTDHCTFNTKEKNKKYTGDIPMGIGGIEHSFILMYTLFGKQIIDKFTLNPAKMFNLYPRKGTLYPGADADVVIFNPNYSGFIKSTHTNADYDLYINTKVKGKVEKVFKSGNLIIENEKLVKTAPGNFLRR
ncbi:amidohydrolase family protein [Thermosipho ferrireducens]|uniref:Amidohydrolase family protein n=1 Tax=Thermosipho ferrireducens TaxID=2571116 RepID=A0ABX7S8U0_9BACT|nr:amidohydrolase family protein [Thermosipho ferrireducens]QTA37728.1 amidohydrolase family protein [Thermosipho ferrireducens]